MLTPGGDRSDQAGADRHGLDRASVAIPESTEKESHDHNRRGYHGGDHAPRPEVEGSVLAVQEYGVRVLLVGQPNVIRAELARFSRPAVPIAIVPAS